ncbi:MAG: hypothetical protein IJ129_04895 [Ruminococcus sp.]|nr:hypothetical protein [Ruminococcus sp.]
MIGYKFEPLREPWSMMRGAFRKCLAVTKKTRGLKQPLYQMGANKKSLEGGPGENLSSERFPPEKKTKSHKAANSQQGSPTKEEKLSNE